jgi:hypothetical protein
MSNRLTKIIATEPIVKIRRFWFIDNNRWSTLAEVAPPENACATPPINNTAAATQAASNAIRYKLFMSTLAFIFFLTFVIYGFWMTGQK